MHLFRKLSAQAIACVVLSSHAFGADSVPESDHPRTPSRIRHASPSHKIPDRLWVFRKPVVIGDLEFVPKLGGEITEIALFKLKNTECVDTFHTYVQTLEAVKNPHVKSTAPVDLTQQPTFAESAPAIAEFINGTIFYSWGAADPHKLAQNLRMQGGANGSIPTGTIIKFKHANGLEMERRDKRRRMGEDVTSPLHEKFTVFVGSPTSVKAEYAEESKRNKEKRLKAQKRKENRQLDREIAILTAKANDEGTPKLKERKKSVLAGTSFTQEEVAKRKGVTPALGAASIGSNADELNKDHEIPKKHANQLHRAMSDTQVLAGLLMAQVQPTLERQILPKAARKLAFE